MRAQLLDSIAYDLWANKLWLEFLEVRIPTIEQWAVFDHIHRSQMLWYKVITSTQLQLPTERLQKSIDLNTAWKSLIEITDPIAYSSFNSNNGKTIFASVDQIVNHMVNHGTYHRGQLREIFSGFKGLPETDLIIFHHPDTEF